jgi:hypothetical protein
MKRFTDSVDEIVALCMSLAGIAILSGGSYAIFCMACEVAVEELMLIAGALIGPSTSYLFGKSVPKKGDNDIKEILMHNMHK